MSREIKRGKEPASDGHGHADADFGSPKHRIVIADDQTILREGLRELLEGQEGLEVIGAANYAREGLSSIGILKPDVMLIDLSMPGMDGIGAIREIKRRSPETKTVVLTSHRSEDYVRAALEAGAHGYVLKEASRAELLMAIQSVLDGKRFISPVISEHIVQRYLEYRGSEPQAPLDKLTAREKQVLKHIAEGRRNREMAEALSISIKTVEKHRSNLMHKLKLHNIAALTSFAMEKGLVGTVSAELGPVHEERKPGVH